jgi:hypothetical protein
VVSNWHLSDAHQDVLESLRRLPAFLECVLSQMVHDANQLVMPGLDPGIHASGTSAAVRGKEVGGRDKPGHDDNVNRMFVSEHYQIHLSWERQAKYNVFPLAG